MGRPQKKDTSRVLGLFVVCRGFGCDGWYLFSGQVPIQQQPLDEYQQRDGQSQRQLSHIP